MREALRPRTRPGGLFPPPEFQKARQVMKQRLIVAAIGVPLVFAVLVLLPPFATAVYTAAICVLGAHEMFCASGAEKRLCAMILCFVSAAAIQLCALIWGYTAAFTVLLPFIFLLFLIWVAYYEKGADFGFTAFGAALFCGFIVPAGLAAMVLLRKQEGGRLLVLMPVVATFIGDSGAYFAGRAFGRRKMSPKTSPNKTVAGLIGALASSALFMTVLGYIMTRFGIDIKLWQAAVIGLICGAAALLGDLSFSVIKRGFGIKDYGRLLPGHGGAYDRFDSSVFAAPAALAILYIMGVI